MKLSDYLKDRVFSIITYIIFMLIMVLLLNAFKADGTFIIAFCLLFLLILLINFIFEYYKRKKFYDDFCSTLKSIDKKMLIIETVKEPEFTEAKIMLDAMYDIRLEYCDEINILEKSVKDFKEYVEMWIHEIKLPLASLVLMNYNKNTEFDKQKKQLELLEGYLDQILYYVRSDVSDKDYMLKKVNLENPVNNVIKKYKELLIGNKIRIKKDNTDRIVITDAKWMEFIIGQIINNSIKYISKEPYISFSVNYNSEITELVIEDNGIGICESDLPRVFDKSFTGENGRIGRNSTGMGLYICSKLCNKLGHSIRIESEQGKYTRVIIGFGNNEFYTDVI